MPDNVVLPAAGTLVATDEVTTINGSAVTAQHVQRVKMGFGADGVQTDVSASSPLPVSGPLTDAQLRAAGVPILPGALSNGGTLGAVGDAVTLDVAGMGGCAIDVRGTFTGTVTFEATIDGANWFLLTSYGAGGGQGASATSTATAAGAWVAPNHGYLRVRARASAGWTGSATVTLRSGSNAAFTYVMTMGAPAVALATAANLAGDFGIQYRGSNTGGGLVAVIASAATPAGAALKSGPGRLLAINLVNLSAGVRWVKFYNATAVTMGTTSAAIDRPIPAGGSLEWNMEGGIGFSTGIAWAVTSARGVTDNTGTGLALGDVCGFTVHA